MEIEVNKEIELKDDRELEVDIDLCSSKDLENRCLWYSYIYMLKLKVISTKVRRISVYDQFA